MKTKNVLLTAIAVVLVSGLAYAIEPGNPKLVVINQKSGVFKVIYEGSKSGKVALNIYDKNNTPVFSETHANGFIRPVNFEGMQAGDYTIEVVDANGKYTQKVSYKNEPSTVKNVHVAKTGEAGKYLLAVASKGNELINVKIYDGSNNLVHNENIAINGNFGMVYDLNKVSGIPTFEVSDKNGNIVSK